MAGRLLRSALSLQILRRQPQPSSLVILSSQQRYLLSTMAHSKAHYDSELSYDNAVKKLNGLQSNAEVLAQAYQNILATGLRKIPETTRSLSWIDLSLDDLDELNVIHVAGTKGKGTTCAFTESVLRHTGLKTGLFSSPHLIAVRERIRINGKPLSTSQFAEYFFQVYNKMEANKPVECDMPAYFQFLTCMAFHVFVQEEVDVAILEVGIGGKYDTTNVIRKPVVVGITSLGLEHQKLLGSTLEEITDQKAGIMKPGVPAFTVHSHPKHIHARLKSNADSVNCPLFVAPELKWYSEVVDLGVEDGVVSRINASLSVQLVNAFMHEKWPEKLFKEDYMAPRQKVSYEHGTPYPLREWHVMGLQNTRWPGRFQVIRTSPVLDYFLDGAHTVDSLEIAKNWFIAQTKYEGRKSFRVLIFHITGVRDAEQMLRPFVECEKFDLVIFCPLIVNKPYENTADNWSAISTPNTELSKCEEHADLWRKMSQVTTDLLNTKVLVMPSIDATTEYLGNLSQNEVPCKSEPESESESESNPNGVHIQQSVQVLITGSLHLVGSFLSYLKPNFLDK